MPWVDWSGAIRVHTLDSRLDEFLADVWRLIEQPADLDRGWLAVRFDDDDWYVLPDFEAAVLLRAVDGGGIASGSKAPLREIADTLKSVFQRATPVREGRSPPARLPTPPVRDVWCLIELDATGTPLRVGMLPALQAGPPPQPVPTRSATRSLRHEAGGAVTRGPSIERPPMSQRPESSGSEPPDPQERGDAERLTRSAKASAPQPESPQRPAQAPRYVQGDLYRQAGSQWLPSEPELAIKHKYRFDVFIGPPGLGSIQADTAFRDDALDWSRAESYRLQVVFAEIGRGAKAQSAFIDLPRTGRSSTCSFLFSPKRLGRFSARISVLHEGRVLQTALIQTVVEPLPRERRGPGDSPALRPTVEMVVRHDLGSLDDRQHFDACLILNHATDGSAAMTAASSDGAYVSSLDDLQAQLASISSLLVELATKSKIHTKGLTTRENAAWLGRLAAEGNFLYRKLVVDYIAKSATAEALRNAEYLQIVSARPDAVVPLEFVYEYPPPKKGAPVCENAAQALLDGKCPASCRPKRSPADRVCPMGFWGLSRVIERHVHDPELPKPAKIVAVEPTAARRTLDVRGASLLAVSEQVKAAERKKLAERVRQHWKGSVSVVEGWESWPDMVSANRPVLFVVLPHTKGKGAEIALEIGGDAIESRYIERSYVYPEDSSAGPPIVLLLGCDTSNTADKDAYTTNIAVFRQAGSAIVLATTAALIWGDDSAKVAGQIVEAFDGAVTDSPQRFGEILRTAKRRSVADSQLMAMCVAAFGDADWQLSVKQGT